MECFPQNSEERHSHVDKSPLEPDPKISSNLGEIAKEDSSRDPIFFKNSNRSRIKSVNADKQGKISGHSPLGPANKSDPTATLNYRNQLPFTNREDKIPVPD